MSILDKASLIQIPSGYKSTKLYSLRPINGDGDFDFSRSSSGTRVNSEGLIEEMSANVPRLDYSDGSCASLLLEPQSTNLSTNSQPTSGDGFQTGVVFQQTDIYDWDGIYYGDNTVRRIAFFSNTTIVGQTYTFSVFIKLTDGSTPSVGNSATDDFRMWNGAATTNSLTITDLGNGIFRCSVVRTATSTTTNVAIEKQTYNSSKTFEVSGYQLEALSYPTSYIPSNSGSQTTRTADVCNNAGTSATFNDSEGVLFADIAVFTSVGNKSITLSDGGNNNRISIGYNTNNRLDVNVISGGSYQVIFNYNGITNPNSFNKIAFKYKENDFALWVNGVEVLTDTSGITPNGLDILNLCSTNAIADFYYGKTKQLMTFNEALSNEELSDLTGQINTSFVQLANFYNYTIL